MPQAADFDFSTPLQYPYQPTGPTFRPPTPPPPAAPQPVRRKALNKPAMGLIFVVVFSVILSVIWFSAFRFANADNIAQDSAFIADGGVILGLHGERLETQEALTAYINRYLAKGILPALAAYYGAAVLIFALAGAKGKLS